MGHRELMGLPDGADGMQFAQSRDIFAATQGLADILARDRLSTEMNTQTHEPGRFWARRLA